MINNNYFLLNVAALAVGTFLIRGFFIALSAKMVIPARVKELFTYIPAAIFPALIMPATFFHQGTVEMLAGKERFLTLIAATLVCFFVKNRLFVIVFGLVLLYLVRMA